MYVNCIGIRVRFSHKEYRVKESDGYVVIKVIVSGHRSFPLQVVAISFVPTKFNLPAGQLNIIMYVYFYLQFILQQTVGTSRLENTNCTSQCTLMWLQSRFQYTMITLLRAPKHLQSVCTYQNTTGTDM